MQKWSTSSGQMYDTNAQTELDSINSKTTGLHVLCNGLMIYGALTGSVHMGLRHVMIIIYLNHVFDDGEPSEAEDLQLETLPR